MNFFKFSLHFQIKQIILGKTGPMGPKGPKGDPIKIQVIFFLIE